MKVRLGMLRALIREMILLEEPTGASGTDPTDRKGFYDYEIERGVDIHGFNKHSPGRPMGTEGDPGRPKDASAYIGLTRPEKSEEGGNDDNEGENDEGTGEGGSETNDAAFDLNAIPQAGTTFDAGSTDVTNTAGSSKTARSR